MTAAAPATLCIALLLGGVLPSGGFLTYVVSYCNFNSSDLQDIEYTRSYFFRRVEYTRFSSSVGKYIGLTEYGVRNAEAWNNNTDKLNAMRAEKERYCKNNIDIDYRAALSKSVQPKVVLSMEDPPAGGHVSMLVCRVYNFYPKQIRVSWLRNAQEVTTDVTSTQEWANGDWYYQVHSHLVYTPSPGEKISCVVEHGSLTQPLHTDWDPSMPESERSKLAIGASGLVLGLVLFLAGFIYYKKKKNGSRFLGWSSGRFRFGAEPRGSSFWSTSRCPLLHAGRTLVPGS